MAIEESDNRTLLMAVCDYGRLSVVLIDVSVNVPVGSVVGFVLPVPAGRIGNRVPVIAIRMLSFVRRRPHEGTAKREFIRIYRLHLPS